MPLYCINANCRHNRSVHGLSSVCMCYDEMPEVDDNGQCIWFSPRKEHKTFNFEVGDKARVILLGDREGNVGKVLAKMPCTVKGIYRYLVSFSDGEVRDYYGDEIEPA